MASNKHLPTHGKATEDDLSNLHGALAQAMAKKLKDKDFSTADMNTIRQFLKDNNISCDPNSNTDIQDVLQNLPQGQEALDDMMAIGQTQ